MLYEDTKFCFLFRMGRRGEDPFFSIIEQKSSEYSISNRMMKKYCEKAKFLQHAEAVCCAFICLYGAGRRAGIRIKWEAMVSKLVGWENLKNARQILREDPRSKYDKKTTFAIFLLWEYFKGICG